MLSKFKTKIKGKMEAKRESLGRAFDRVIARDPASGGHTAPAAMQPVTDISTNELTTIAPSAHIEHVPPPGTVIPSEHAQCPPGNPRSELASDQPYSSQPSPEVPTPASLATPVNILPSAATLSSATQAEASASGATVQGPMVKSSTKHTAWAGFKAFLGLLNESADAFGPLKSAVGGISRFIEIFENQTQAHEDYQRLKTELESLFQDLARYFKNARPSLMTSVMQNVAIGIAKEIDLVTQKRQQSKIERVAEAMEDADSVLKCYRNVQRLWANTTS